jgi:hypothetical protein
MEALCDWGVETKAYEPDGVPWHRHTTPGAWIPVGVMHHHTAGNGKLLTAEATQRAMLRLLRNGRPGLPGPLCHLSPAMVPGTNRARVHLIGWGNVNHAGMGSSSVLSAVRAGKYAGAAPKHSNVDGNAHFWGLEYMHPGTAAKWPDALLEAGHRAACAICQAQGWSTAHWPGSNVEHREWTARKIDRSWTGDLRAAIRTVVEEGKPVALNTADKTWISKEIAKQLDALLPRMWASKAVDGIEVKRPERTGNPKNTKWQPNSVLARVMDDGWKALDGIEGLAEDTREIRCQVAALTAMVEALAGALDEGTG